MIRIILAIAIILAGVSPSLAGGLMVMGGGTPGVCTDANPVGNCTGLDLCQNFEGSPYDNSETWLTYNQDGNCTIDTAYTSTILRGSKSVSMTNTSTGLCLFYHATTDGYMFARVRFSTIPGSGYGSFLDLFDATTPIIGVRVVSDSTFTLFNGTTSTSCGAMSTGTTYYIWLDGAKGTGSNGTANAYISTTATKPGSPTCSVTTGTATTDIASAGLFAYSSAYVADQVLVDSATIGSVCP
jgi:hypothetical protein